MKSAGKEEEGEGVRKRCHFSQPPPPPLPGCQQLGRRKAETSTEKRAFKSLARSPFRVLDKIHCGSDSFCVYVGSNNKGRQ